MMMMWSSSSSSSSSCCCRSVISLCPKKRFSESSSFLSKQSSSSQLLFLSSSKLTPKITTSFSHPFFSPCNKTTTPTTATCYSIPQNNNNNNNENSNNDILEFVTSERVKVVGMVALALALCNADRVVMSVAIVPLSVANSWSQSKAGIVQSSFLWGYLMSPIAGGALVDYYGGKAVMAGGVALWSLATFFTPWAAEKSLWALLTVRVLLGVAEGVALPCMNNMIARWFPQNERSRAVGFAMAGFQLGSALGLILSPILMSKGGVFGPFVIFGLSGFLWVLVWLSATSSSPDRSTQISKYELAYIQSQKHKSFMNAKNLKTTNVIPPFRILLSKMATWSLIVAHLQTLYFMSQGFFVILSWMPIYFKTISLVDLRQAAWFSAVPWSMMAVVGLFAGALSNWLIQKGMSVSLTHKIMQTIGFLGPGIALIGLTMAKCPIIASAWLTLAVGLKSFSHCGFLVNFQEVAPQYSGVLHGISNTAGTFAEKNIRFVLIYAWTFLYCGNSWSWFLCRIGGFFPRIFVVDITSIFLCCTIRELVFHWGESKF